MSTGQSIAQFRKLPPKMICTVLQEECPPPWYRNQGNSLNEVTCKIATVRCFFCRTACLADDMKKISTVVTSRQYCLESNNKTPTAVKSKGRSVYEIHFPDNFERDMVIIILCLVVVKKKIIITKVSHQSVVFAWQCTTAFIQCTAQGRGNESIIR